MRTYERVTYRPVGAQRARTVLLENPREHDSLGGILTGVEVDRTGTQVGTLQVSKREHVMSLDVIISRVPMVMNLHYGRLEPIECYQTPIPRHDYQDTDTPGVHECTRCRRRISIEVVAF